MANPTYIQKTIVEQMGGNKFRVMVGCKRMVIDGDKPSVMFTIGGGALKRIKFVKVELMGDDTYTMTFSKIFKDEHKIINIVQGVYCDMLQGVFTENTGMHTHL